MSLFLIDDLGEVWRSDSRALREAFDSPYSGGEFIEYAIRNLGFVGINIFGRSCQVRLRPDFVSERTTLGLLDWLGRSKTERVVLSLFESEWRDELLIGNRSLQRLEAVLDQGKRAKPDDFLSAPLTPDDIRSRSTLHDVLSTWPHLVGSYDARALIMLLRSVLGDRIVVLGKSPDQDRIQFREFGRNMFSDQDTWRMCAVGAPIEEMPDREFGRWVSKSYYEVLETGTPSFDSIDAIGNFSGTGRTRRRYRRFILPLPDDSASKLLVGGSIVDTSVDLRVAAR
ncbi:MAG: hypothetical protein R3D67_14170 [Hyphomicrobiaceae bacterium]